MPPQPLICVTVKRQLVVLAAARVPRGTLGGSQYEQLVKDGRLILQLHSFEVEHHHVRISSDLCQTACCCGSRWMISTR